MIKTTVIFFLLMLVIESGGLAMNGKESYETATLGGGCFWCTEAVFQRMKGVISVMPGYSGGHMKNPTYEEVCTGSTGHAEVIQISYDPSVISFSDILKVFFEIHDPTTLNRQGADVGTQYRSVIFYHSEEQKQTAADMIAKLNGTEFIVRPIVTEVTPFTVFYPAESYHKDYYNRNSGQPYCRMVISPKLQKFQKLFIDFRK